MKNINVPIPDKLKERLDKFCLRTDLKKKWVIEDAITEYLNRRKRAAK